MSYRDLLTAQQTFRLIGLSEDVGWWALSERLLPPPLFTDPQPLWSRQYMERWNNSSDWCERLEARYREEGYL